MFKKLLAFVATMYVAMAFAAIDVNSATSAELDAIKGIGPVKSALIISERKKAPFKDWNDFVTRVKGVGTDSAAKFSADGLTVNGTSYKAEVKADKPVTEKAKDAAVATKDAVKGAAIATKDAAKETARDVKAAVTPKADTKAEVKADVKAGAKTEPAKK
ncbi:MAG: helix-hairpin-helix domain-containing protein [Polaromonas sp.]|uniref:ComEA family DNA-binding protein n=1 Tax=Polaromonas sp. TaxID=1869339 RepID=UPI002730E7EB|nr:helix-hairpin-helix domain-containing protein [Polaromonas sp.]MDP2450236.1 helix-hairpin-helix domain-containing protein [Polaromonas sp.]MDP3250090.1 helix-hairpin-helix domain-containing protein [Polaromonas sp.]MDP3756550.1 helix-hairpin-helix domain-containing protein [Polaromonas sp.]